MRIASRLLWALVALALAGVGCAPEVSDTGYVGTWSRGSRTKSSTIAIVASQDGYKLRWAAETSDGAWKVRCDWQGQCEELLDGEKVGQYEFRTWVEGKRGRLMVECKGKKSGLDEEVDVHYIDVLEVRRGGKKLDSRTVERDGRTYQRRNQSKRVFEKVSDAVVDPPAEPSGTGSG